MAGGGSSLCSVKHSSQVLIQDIAIHTATSLFFSSPMKQKERGKKKRKGKKRTVTAWNKTEKSSTLGKTTPKLKGLGGHIQTNNTHYLELA